MVHGWHLGLKNERQSFVNIQKLTWPYSWLLFFCHHLLSVIGSFHRRGRRVPTSHFLKIMPSCWSLHFPGFPPVTLKNVLVHRWVVTISEDSHGFLSTFAYLYLCLLDHILYHQFKKLEPFWKNSPCISLKVYKLCFWTDREELFDCPIKVQMVPFSLTHLTAHISQVTCLFGNFCSTRSLAELWGT